MKYILAMDQGTTSSRAILFDQQGSIRAQAQKEFRQLFPQPGWVEHDPEEIWECQRGVAVEAARQAGADAAEIAAIGITNQRETTVIWDRESGEPIHNAIVWQDRRTAAHCDELKAQGLESLFQEKTGLLLDAYFSGTKIAWLLDNVPQARRRAEAGQLAFGTIDTWLLWKLSGGRVHLTDVSNASRTLLCNIHTCGWDDELLEILNVPRSLLPEIRSSSEVYTEAQIEELSGPIPISGIAGDQQAALFGQACLQPGMVKNTYGTGCFLLMNTGSRPVLSRNRLLTTLAYRIGERTKYALEGSVFIAGAVVQWLRDGLSIIEESSQVEELAATVPDSGGVFFVPAFAGLGAPHWDPYARGALVGLTRQSNRGHIARAALEGIAFQVADVLSSMRADSGIDPAQVRVDGGGSANDLLLQFQADLLGVPVVRSRVGETTALGAAYLAGLAIGYWKSEDEITSQWGRDRTFEPSMGAEKAARLRSDWKRALERSMAWEKPSKRQ